MTQLAWDAAIAAFKYCSVADASYVVANAQNGQVTVYWGSPNQVIIVRNTTGTFTAPTNGTQYAVGNTIGSGNTVVYFGAAGSFTQTTSDAQNPVSNGQTYYYKVFTNCALSYSSGVSVTTTPSTAPPVWSYATTATTLAAPGLDDNNVVVWGGNDNDIHGAYASNGTLAFAPFTQPTGAIQARPTIIPAAYSATGVTVAYVTSQDGYVYAINTSTGAQVWKSTVPGGGLLQGGAAVWLKVFAPSVQICGAITDVVFVGTRNTGTTTGNSVYALNGGTTNVTSTGGGNCRANGTTVVPGDYLWKFTGGGTNPSMHYISSTPYVDYTNQVVWVTSRAAGGTTQPSLWKFNVTNGMLANGTTSCGSGATTSCWNLGDIDNSPSPSFDGTWMYVGTNTGTPAATLQAIQGATVVSYTPAVGTGNVGGPYPLGLTPIRSTTTIAYVNAAVGTGTTSTSTTCPMTLGAVTAGNTLVVIVGINQNANVTTISDTVGSTYIRRNAITGGTTTHAEIWTATVRSTAASDTVTVTLPSSWSICAVGQYSGVGAIGLNNATQANSAGPSISSNTQDNNNWVVTGFAIQGKTAPTQSANGFVRPNSSTFPNDGSVSGVVGALCDNTSAAAGSVSCTLGHNSTQWSAVAVELRSVTVDTIIFTQGTYVQSVSFDGSTLSNNWAVQLTGTPTLSAPVDDGAGHLYIGGSDGKVHQLDVTTGTDQKQVATPGSTATVGDPSFDGVLNRIYVGASDGHVYAIGTPF